MPAQPCFKLASALLVTYGEEGILAVQESLREARPLGAAPALREGRRRSALQVSGKAADLRTLFAGAIRAGHLCWRDDVTSHAVTES